MTQTAKITGKLEIPLEDGGLLAPFVLDSSFPFVQKANFDLSYPGATVDDAIDLETLASGGLKLLLIKSKEGGCSVKINGASAGLPIAAGAGYILYVNPGAGGITALSVTTTGIARVTLVGLG